MPAAGPSVGVIGAGSSGLAAGRNFLAEGFEVEVFEQESDLGGLWHYGQASGRVYRSTHTISSKPGTEYSDFPMPAEFPDYPHHTQILAYLRAYARQFDLIPRIRFGTPVTSVRPISPQDRDTRWEITLADGATRSFDLAVIASGHNWCPRMPEYPGRFSGIALHSAEYRTPDLFLGHRVLVVGGGNSGCDIAVEAAQVGAPVWHSTRRGYWYMPKYLMGRPADQVGDRLLALRAPLWLRRAAASLLYRTHVGSPQRIGLPRPDHRLFETHPIVNSLLPYYVRHGAITAKPDIARFEGRTVRFGDGSSVEVDIVVFATGFLIRFPFLDEGLLGEPGRPRLYLHVFHPFYDTVFVAGLIQPDSGQFGLVHWQMRAAALYARGRREGRAAAESLRRHKSAPDLDLGHGIRYKESPRHHLEVEHWSYERRLRDLAKGLSRPSALPR